MVDFRYRAVSLNKLARSKCLPRNSVCEFLTTEWKMSTFIQLGDIHCV